MANKQALRFDPLFDMTHKVALIIGSGGLGRHIAMELSGRGARVAIFDLKDEHLRSLEAELPGVFTGSINICNTQALRTMIETVMAEFGRIDCAINATGILHTAPALELPLEAFQQSLEVNLTGAFQFSRELAKVMIKQGGGRILHLASVSSFVSNRNYAAYTASKAGLSQLIRVLAREWAPHNVLVNAIGPSMAATDMTRGTFDNEEKRRKALSVIPMGRFCEPQDLTGTVILMLSEAGRYITGQTIFVDGGRTLA